MTITWVNEKRRLKDLIPWERNPRQIKQDQAKRLVESFDTFGQVETIAIGSDGSVYNGHQRLKVLLDKHGADYEVEVRVSSRPLSEKEREKLTIFLHKGAAGEWDFDTLANEFEIPELIEWGFKPYELGIPGDPDDPNAEWKGMPEFEEKDLAPYKSIVVHFADQDDIDLFEKLIGYSINSGGGGATGKSIWYPKPEILHQSLVVDHGEP